MWKLCGLLVLVSSLLGCTAWTEGYQKAVYGTVLEPGQPCPKGQVWQYGGCQAKPGGAS